MKPEHYLKKVKESKEFKEFMKEDPKAYLCSLFFIRDPVENHNETQVDFYSPKIKKITSFKVSGNGKGVERVPINKKAETLTHKKLVPKPLKEIPKVDADELQGILADEMHNRGMTYEIQKILAFLNVTDDRTMWNCTAFLKGLGLLQAHVEDKTGTVLFMEKKSFFDLMGFAKGLGGQPQLGKPGLGVGQPGQGLPQGAQIIEIDPKEFAALQKQAKKQSEKKTEKPDKNSEKKTKK